MKTSAIMTTVGRVNMTTQLAEMFVFFVPRRGQRGVVESFLGKAAKDMARFTDSPVRQFGGVQVIPSLSDRPAEIGGNTATASYTLVDGAILKVFAKQKSGGWTSLMSSEVLYLKVRADAALRKLSLPCPESNRVAVNQFEITGNFDIITVDEVIACGGTVNALSRKVASNTASLIRVEELAPATAPAPKEVVIETSDGEKRVMTKVKRLRRLS
jgi:hypothetical protein